MCSKVRHIKRKTVPQTFSADPRGRLSQPEARGQGTRDAFWAGVWRRDRFLCGPGGPQGTGSQLVSRLRVGRCVCDIAPGAKVQMNRGRGRRPPPPLQLLRGPRPCFAGDGAAPKPGTVAWKATCIAPAATDW